MTHDRLPLELETYIFELAFIDLPPHLGLSLLKVSTSLYPNILPFFLRKPKHPLLPLAFALPRTHWMQQQVTPDPDLNLLMANDEDFIWNEWHRFIESFKFHNAGDLSPHAAKKIRNIASSIKHLDLMSSDQPNALEAVSWINGQLGAQPWLFPDTLIVPIKTGIRTILDFCDLSQLSTLHIPALLSPLSLTTIRDILGAIPPPTIRCLHEQDTADLVVREIFAARPVEWMSLTLLSISVRIISNHTWADIALLPRLDELRVSEHSSVESSMMRMEDFQPHILRVRKLVLKGHKALVHWFLEDAVILPMIERAHVVLQTHPTSSLSFAVVRRRLLVQPLLTHLRFQVVMDSDDFPVYVSPQDDHPKPFDVSPSLRQLLVEPCCLGIPLSGIEVDRLELRLFYDGVYLDLDALQGCCHIARQRWPFRLFVSYTEDALAHNDHRERDVWITLEPPTLRAYVGGEWVGWEHSPDNLKVDNRGVHWLVSSEEDEWIVDSCEEPKWIIDAREAVQAILDIIQQERGISL